MVGKGLRLNIETSFEDIYCLRGRKEKDKKAPGEEEKKDKGEKFEQKDDWEKSKKTE